MAGSVGTLTPRGPHVGAPLLLGEPGLSVRIIVRACPSPARSQRWMQRCPPRGFWGLPIEARLIYEASGASRVVLRHEEEYLRALLTPKGLSVPRYIVVNAIFLESSYTTI